MRARSPVDVLLGEAVFGSVPQRYQDLEAIASVMQNRANALGVSLNNVVQNRREFSAYGRALPKGVEKYRSLAQQALDNVSKYGPTHGASFYATPGAAKNLPKGLKAETQTAGHQFFSDPLNRAIGTAIGYRKPSAEAQQQLADLANADIPTPMDRPLAPANAAPVGKVTRGLLGELSPAAPASMPSVGLLGTMSRLSAPDAMTTGATTQAQQPVGGLLAQTLAEREQTMKQTPGYQSLQSGLLSQTSQLQNLKGTVANLRTDLKQQAQEMDARKRVANFEADRFATNPVAVGTADLAKQLARQNTLATQPAYQDQYVTTDQQQVTPQAYQPTKPPSPAEAAINAAAAPAGIPSGGYSYDPVAAQKAKEATFNNKLGGLLGTLGPAVIGGILAGPIGGLIGGYLGKQATQKALKMPDAPAQKAKSERLTRDKLDAEGKGMYDRSSQVRDVVDNNAPGLW